MASPIKLEVHDVQFAIITPHRVHHGTISGGLIVYDTKRAENFFGSNMAQYSRGGGYGRYTKVAQAVQDVLKCAISGENYQFMITPEKGVIINNSVDNIVKHNNKLEAIYSHLRILLKTPEEEVGEKNSLQVFFYQREISQVYCKEILDRVEADKRNHSYIPIHCNCNKN